MPATQISPTNRLTSARCVSPRYEWSLMDPTSVDWWCRSSMEPEGRNYRGRGGSSYPFNRFELLRYEPVNTDDAECLVRTHASSATTRVPCLPTMRARTSALRRVSTRTAGANTGARTCYARAPLTNTSGSQLGSTSSRGSSQGGGPPCSGRIRQRRAGDRPPYYSAESPTPTNRPTGACG